MVRLILTGVRAWFALNVAIGAVAIIAGYLKKKPTVTPQVAKAPSLARVKVSPVPFWLVVPDHEHSYELVDANGQSHLTLTTLGHRALAGLEGKN
jgi:hypothetical protein